MPDGLRTDLWPASKFMALTKAVPEFGPILLKDGAFVFNDVFLDLWKNDADICLLYGSYGSGKSVHVAKTLIEMCLNSKYFKCYYGRKVFADVRGSVFDTICDAIEEHDLQGFFHYSRKDNSSMVITCLLNGNKFVPFGSDDPAKLKSIKDPTHIVFEEADKFEEEDFKIIYPRLRTTKGKTQLYMMFNTAAVYDGHWIFKYFFQERLRPGERKPDLVDIKILKNFSTYKDNFFIDKADYEQKLRLASGGSNIIFEAIANGAWGAVENEHPWLYNFKDDKHLKDVPLLPSFPVYISFDFNNDPFAAVAFQMSPGKGTSNDFLHFIREFSGRIKLEEMAAQIRQAFPASILYVTGDKSGNNMDLGRNQTLYQTLARYLNISNRQLHLNTYNLEHADSRILCNTMFGLYPNVFINPSGCPTLVRQCRNAAVDLESRKPSHLLKDRGANKNDEFDAMRYAMQTYYNDFVRKNYLVAKSQSRKG